MGEKQIFAFVVDGEVFHTMVVPTSVLEAKRLVAGLMSDPKIVPVYNNEDILRSPNWKYDEKTNSFYKDGPDVNSFQEPDYEVED